jgi:phosphodiesterase/alkaline phosphatase D-like protein
VWTLIVIVAIGVVSLMVGFPRDLHSDGMLGPIEQPAQLALLAVATVAWVVAWRSESAAAVLLAAVGVGIGALSMSLNPALTAVLLTGAFLLSAVMFWVLWQHTQRRRAIASLAAVTAVVLVAGAAGTGALHRVLYGPTHPESATAAPPVDRVAWVWSGGVTDASFRVTARVTDDAAARATLLVWEDGSPPTRAMEHPPEPAAGPAVPETGIATWTVTDLEPDTRYEYGIAVDDRADRARGRGSVHTFPNGPAWFTVAIGADARSRSNGAVFDAIREVEPLLYINAGDLHYGNIDADDIDLFRARYDDVLNSPAQSALYRSVPTAYTWDDHDFGANAADADSPGRRAARLAYRESVPHYPLPAGDGDAAIYQAFTIGRVRFVLTDTRSERTADSMLGDRQLRWLEHELVTASRNHALVVWVSSVPWIAPAGAGRDDWGGYPLERQRLAEVIEQAAIENLVMLGGDAHMVAIDDGSNSGYGPSGRGFPVLHAAALDRPGSVKGGPYSHGAVPGGGQFGTLTVLDDGTGSVTVRLEGRDWTGQVLLSHTFHAG